VLLVLLEAELELSLSVVSAPGGPDSEHAPKPIAKIATSEGPKLRAIVTVEVVMGLVSTAELERECPSSFARSDWLLHEPSKIVRLEYQA
jgi:hypothetical protein